MNRIAVVGASGFVGSALCERLFFEGISFTPFVRGTGNAARISRLSIPIRRLDLLDSKPVLDALTGFDIVVNCSLGDKAAVRRGFHNLLLTMERLRTSRLIHLSSASIYGVEPKPHCITEQGPPDPQSNEYAEMKLRQDESIFRLSRKGVSTYILCPGAIVGPYSVFSIGLAQALRSGPMPLVDGGVNPSNLVHVDNLVEAILAAARSPSGAGERYFVNETRPVSWRTVFADHARILGIEPEFVQVTTEQVRPFLPTGPRRASLRDQGRVLISPEFRQAASRLAPIGWINDLASATFWHLPSAIQNRLRERLQWPISVNGSGPALPLNSRFVTAQVRAYYQSPNKLVTRLGWSPPLSYEAGMETIATWFKFAGMVDSRV
jgi:nucleoside-diphosphate-sugar epimerase